MKPTNDQSANNKPRTQFEFEDYLSENLKTSSRPQVYSNQYGRNNLGIRFFIRRLVESYFISRLSNALPVSRFLFIWLILVAIVSSGLILQMRQLTIYNESAIAQRGGTYTEGVVGRLTNFNPIYATTEADQSIASVVFAPLFSYDSNNELYPVLAESIISDDKAQQFTLKLKPDLKWHDGQLITADDVIFTIRTIQNPNAQSPFRANWEGVEVDKIDDYSLVFTLEGSFSPFVANLTLKIIPEHLLKDESASNLRRANFNQQPIGSGPFKFSQLTPLSNDTLDQREFRVELIRNDDWQLVDGQEILLNQFYIWAVADRARLTELFNQGLISGSLHIDGDQIDLPVTDYQVTDLKLLSGVYLLFNNSDNFTSERLAREAIVGSLDIAELLGSLDYTPERILGPLLPEHLGYSFNDQLPAYNPDRSAKLLNQLGFSQQNDGWYKDNQRLALTLTVQQDTDYEILARNIQSQLSDIGIKVILDVQSAENIPLDVLQNHRYGQMIIYGYNLGNDADVYSYWHSSQIDSHSIFRLNLAEYSSAQADQTLEVGRTRYDLDIRRSSYEDFQTQWLLDLPALSLYRPRINYYTLEGVRGPNNNLLLNRQSDRFYDIHNWATVFGY